MVNPYVPNSFPQRLITGSSADTGRMKVDVAQTGFFEGREFRMSYEFDIASGANQVLKFSATSDFILWEQRIEVDEGFLIYTPTIDPATATGFVTTVPQYGKNRMSVAPVVTNTVTVTTGGTITGGTVVETARIKVANASGQQQSVGGVASSERGLPAGDYYLMLHAEGSITRGVINLIYEIRP